MTGDAELVTEGFLLTRQWRDTAADVELEFWLATDRGPVRLMVPAQRPLLFLPDNQIDRARPLLARFPNCSIRSVAMKDFSMRPVSGVYFHSQRTLRQARDVLLANGLDAFESDINVCDRFLMERFVRGGLRADGTIQRLKGFSVLETDRVMAADVHPNLKVISLDIETAMHDLELFSIAVYAEHDGKTQAKVFMVSDQPLGDGVHCFVDQQLLLRAFLRWLAEYDPDVIIGWNVVNFDLWFLERLCRRYQMRFSLGRNDMPVHWRTLDDEGQRHLAEVSGRIVLDGIELLKTATYQFESFALDVVAGEVLGEGKLLIGGGRGEKIAELFRSNKSELANYNLQDCRLVWDIFARLKLLDFAIARSRMTGLPLDRVGGSVAAFEYRYLPLLHRQHFVAPNAHLIEDIEHSPGGFVMDSMPGLYSHVLVLDFKSLYPSIIRSFRIDPLGLVLGTEIDRDQSDLVPGFKGAWFAREPSILPGLIEELWGLRDRARRSDDKAQSQAIKILMNSFYGVLGARGCRFFDARLASSITRRGHQIIQQTAKRIEELGWSVIYGDTDSVFVWLKGVDNDGEALKVGKTLQDTLNEWWRRRLKADYGIECALELEFETHFQRFLMPTIRGSDRGSKKRYAGVVEGADGQRRVVFKGLEAVRSDWTALAREFQKELYRRIFFDEPYRDYIREVVAGVKRGELDEKLVYRKRLRRKLGEYQRNVPPHVQAARKAVSLGKVEYHRGDWIEYVMTLEGAEPLVLRDSRHAGTRIDYQHYIDKQLAPVADGILLFLGESLSGLTDQQYRLAF